MVNELARTVYAKLPGPVKRIVDHEIGAINGLDSLHVDPDANGVIWRGIEGTLRPELEIVPIRAAVRDLQAGNPAGAVRLRVYPIVVT